MTKICKHIEDLSKSLWDYMSDVYSFSNTKVAEIGITNDLIYRVVKFYGYSSRLCEVYINPAYKESVSGADIELVIFENSVPQHYYLQAKVLSGKGIYEDIKPYRYKSSHDQYKKLIRYAHLNNGIPYYLFYNGYTVGSKFGNSRYGYSIVSADDILANRKNASSKYKRIPKIKFDDIYSLMQPFYSLFCKKSNITGLGRITNTNISKFLQTGVPYLKIGNENTEEEQRTSTEILNNPKYQELPKYKIIIYNNQKPTND